MVKIPMVCDVCGKEIMQIEAADEYAGMSARLMGKHEGCEKKEEIKGRSGFLDYLPMKDGGDRLNIREMRTKPLPPIRERVTACTHLFTDGICTECGAVKGSDEARRLMEAAADERDAWESAE